MTTKLSPNQLLLQLSEKLSSSDGRDQPTYDEFAQLYYKVLTILSNHGDTTKVADDENNKSSIDLITPLLNFINLNVNYGQKTPLS